MKSEAEQQQELVDQIRGALELSLREKDSPASLDSSFVLGASTRSSRTTTTLAPSSIACEEPAEVKRFLAKWEALRQAIAARETRLADALELVRAVPSRCTLCRSLHVYV